MPLQATSGAASYDAFGGGVPVIPNYIEDVFSTYLYTGTGASLTITNNLDLSTKGGMVWFKNRNGTFDHSIFDTARGVTKSLRPNSLIAEATEPDGLTAFNANGFTIGNWSRVNSSTSTTYVSWTFRKQPKFFDIVTYTGTGENGNEIFHNLGSTPGCIIVKNYTGTANNWPVYHRSIPNDYTRLNLTNFAADSGGRFTQVGSTKFNLSSDNDVNGAGKLFVAYLFAHDAGGFGLTGTDNVISCGSYVGDGTTRLINIGYEPQWILIKNASSSTAPQADWRIVDNMRGFTATGNSAILKPNLSDAETNDNPITIASQGFNTNNLRNTGETYIYIAIRRGPMKVPTTGTSVFSTSISSSTTGVITSGFVTDVAFTLDRTTGTAPYNRAVVSRLRGNFLNLSTATSGLDITNTSTVSFQQNNGIYLNGGSVYANGYVYEQFVRAPSFFDEVCYTCNDQASAITSNHNLNVIPEMMIAKKRAVSGDWSVYHKGLNGGVTPQNYRIRLNATNAAGAASGVWNNTAPTLTQFTVGTDSDVNSGTEGAVAYLFATCPGVSKVGSYTGTGTTLQVDCGFTGGARFVLIKRTDASGDWYVWDTARGIVSGNDPYLLLNSTAAEDTSTDYIDTYSAGFEISSTAPAAINASGGTYIFLAIA